MRADDEGQPYALVIGLPAGAVPQHGVTIVSYFNAEGTTCYGLALEGDASLSSILGLLELIKARVLREAEDW
jgi:hypothetical protein